MGRRPKGTGNIRQRENGTWEGRYRNSAGKRVSIYRNTKKEVKEELEKLIYVHNNSQFDDTGGDVPLSIWFEHYIELKQYSVRPQTIEQMKMAFHNHIEPIIGKKEMCNITPNDTFQVLTAAKEKGLSLSTQSNIYTHMNAMFNFAASERVIQRSPMLVVKNESRCKTTRRALTNEEITIILQYLRDRDYKFYLITCTLLYTGMRAGELCGIKWKDFDKDFTTVDVTESLTSKKYGHETKTKYSQRTIPLNDFLREEFIKRSKAKGSLYDPDEYVFLNRYKKPYYTQLIDIRFKVYKKEIEQTYGIDLTGITPHYFRHTFATKGIESGVDIVSMKDLLGHASCETLLQTYAHANAKTKATSIQRITQSIQS